MNIFVDILDSLWPSMVQNKRRKPGCLYWCGLAIFIGIAVFLWLPSTNKSLTLSLNFPTPVRLETITINGYRAFSPTKEMKPATEVSFYGLLGIKNHDKIEIGTDDGWTFKFEYDCWNSNGVKVTKTQEGQATVAYAR